MGVFAENLGEMSSEIDAELEVAHSTPQPPLASTQETQQGSDHDLVDGNLKKGSRGNTGHFLDTTSDRVCGGR